MKKIFVLDDETLMHLAISLLLEKIPAEMVHFRAQDELTAKLGADVTAVIVDLATKGLDLKELQRELAKKAKDAKVVLIGEKERAKTFTGANVLVTEEPYGDRAQVEAYLSAD